jgi:hypothetical protein
MMSLEGKEDDGIDDDDFVAIIVGEVDGVDEVDAVVSAEDE